MCSEYEVRQEPSPELPALSRRRCCRGEGRRAGSGGLGWEFDHEAGAAAGAGGYLDGAVMPLDVAGDDGQAEADTAAAAGGLAPAEALEDPGAVLDRDTGAGVVDRDDDAEAAGPDADALATTGVVLGVLDQVGDHPLEPALVGLQREPLGLGLDRRHLPPGGRVSGRPDQIRDPHDLAVAPVATV